MRGLCLVVAIVLMSLSGCDDERPPPDDAGADGDVDGDADASEPECRHDDDCVDAHECTDEYCQGGRCRYTTHDDRCDDGLQCNGQEVCDSVEGCTDGEPLVCDDHIACTNDRCDPVDDRCVAEPDHDLCPGGYRCDPAQDGCVPM